MRIVGVTTHVTSSETVAVTGVLSVTRRRTLQSATSPVLLSNGNVLLLVVVKESVALALVVTVGVMINVSSMEIAAVIG